MKRLGVEVRYGSRRFNPWRSCALPRGVRSHLDGRSPHLPCFSSECCGAGVAGESGDEFRGIPVVRRRAPSRRSNRPAQ
jgi:hypothetical protein